MTMLDIGAVMGLVLTVIGLIFAGFQLWESRKIAKGEFLLRLDELLQEHNDVHLRLRPGGEWEGERGGPTTAPEWSSVESYMVLFERIEVLVDSKIVDIKTIDQLYGYRVLNIVDNTVIYQEKLVKEKKFWEKFIKLYGLIEKQHK